jgi:hypothetical protein
LLARAQPPRCQARGQDVAVQRHVIGQREVRAVGGQIEFQACVYELLADELHRGDRHQTALAGGEQPHRCGQDEHRGDHCVDSRRHPAARDVRADPDRGRHRRGRRGPDEPVRSSARRARRWRDGAAPAGHPDHAAAL